MSRNKENLIWNFFVNENDEGYAVCMTCKKKLKNNRVSNLKAHLLHVHKINCESDSINTTSSSTSSSSKVIRKKKIKIEINKKQLIRAYIGLVTEDSIPFNVLNSKNMRTLLNPICDGLRETDGTQIALNASNCKNTLKLVANNIKSDITEEIQNRLVSLKIDSATRLCRNIFGISAQYISNSEIKSRIIGMVELKGIGSSSSKNLAIEIIKILKKYDISLRQIVSVTSDNGANMLKATKILSAVSEEDIEENEADWANDEYLKKVEILEEIPNMLLGNIQVCRCAAHTAQLCALDVTKSTAITNYIFTYRNLTKYIRKTSNGYRHIFEMKQLKMPQLDCPTRWGSTYTMLENLKAAKDVLSKIDSVKNKTQDENFDIDNSFWEFIDCYRLVFSPLQKTIKIFQQENLHYGNFYAQWLKCKIFTEKIISDANNPLIQTIGDMILQSFERRTKTLMDNNSLIACLYLDPRFHHILTTKQKIEATNYLKTIWNRINEINPAPTAPDIIGSTPNSSVHQPTVQFLEDEDQLLHEYLSKGIQVNASSIVDVHTKIDNLQLPFLRNDTNVLTFWKGKEFTDPELYALSNVCFAIPPTQVTIERAFSTLKQVLTDYRNRLSEDTLENILLVRLNPGFLEAAIDNLPLFNDQCSDENN